MWSMDGRVVQLEEGGATAVESGLHWILATHLIPARTHLARA